MSTQQWFHLTATNVCITPYQSSSPCRTYKNIAIYAEIKGIPLAVKLTESHIFVSYLRPDGEDRYIEGMIQEGSDMAAYNKYYFEHLLNIVPSRPYQSLISINLETRVRYCNSFRKYGYGGLSEFDLLSIMFYLWSSYYGENSVYPLGTKHSRFGVDALLLNETRQDVTFFEDPYDVKTMEHMTVRELFERVHGNGFEEAMVSLTI
jgi:hypothetical protein